MTTLALVVATNQPEIKTWMVLVRANLIRRIPPQSSFFSKQSVSFHRLSVCLVFPHISPAGSLYGRAVDRQATQSLGQRKRTSGRQGNWPDTLPSAIHSTFLPQPCPNPTTPPPLPSASPPRPLPLLAPSSEIFHPAHPTPMQLPEVS